jgi:hypothetical protein
MVYDILLPSVPVLVGYLLSYTLYRADLIKKSLHVNIWNLIIGASFLISGLAGFILLILLDLGISLPVSAQLLYWHVEFGITVAIVTIFHFHTYWKSSKTMFVKAKRRSGS